MVETMEREGLLELRWAGGEREYRLAGRPLRDGDRVAFRGASGWAEGRWCWSGRRGHSPQLLVERGNGRPPYPVWVNPGMRGRWADESG